MVGWCHWICVDSGSWWWTGRPGLLRFMGLQIVRQDWATELYWTEVAQRWIKLGSVWLQSQDCSHIISRFKSEEQVWRHGGTKEIICNRVRNWHCFSWCKLHFLSDTIRERLSRHHFPPKIISSYTNVNHINLLSFQLTWSSVWNSDNLNYLL